MSDTIGRRIAQRRKMLSLSQEALGEKMGVSRQAISKWEADASIPEVDRLIEMGKLFGVSVDWLLSGDESSLPEEDPDLTETISQTLASPIPPAPEEPTDPEPAPEPEPPTKEKKKRPWLTIGCVILTTASLIMSTLSLLRPTTVVQAPQTEDVPVQERVTVLEKQRTTLMVRISELEQEVRDLEKKLGPTYSNEGPNGKTTHISISDWTLTAEAAELIEGESRVMLRLTFVPTVDLESAQFGISEENGGSQVLCKKEGDYYIATTSVAAVDDLGYYLLLKYADGTQERIRLDGHGLSDLATLSQPTVRIGNFSLVEGKSTMDRFWVGFNKIYLEAPPLNDNATDFLWSDLKISCYIDGEKILEKDVAADYDSVLAGIALDQQHLTITLPSVRYDIGKYVNSDTIQMRIEGKLTIDGTTQDFSLPLITWKVLSNVFVEQAT